MSVKTKQIVETATSTFERTDQGVIITRKKKNSFVELENAIENCLAHRKLADNSPIPCMIVMDEMQNTSPEALEYYSETFHGEYRSAEAFVVKELGVKIIVDHYLKNANMPYPRMAFDNEKDALNWLSSYL